MNYEHAVMDISALIPYVNNSRTHSEEQVLQIASSIKEFGFTNPVLIDDEKSIIAGHGRVLAARKLGINEIPCIVLSGLSKAQKKAYVIADNQIALNAGWDFDLLKVEIELLQEFDYDLDLLGFDDSTIGSILSSKELMNDNDNFDSVDDHKTKNKCPRCSYEFD